MYFIVTCLLGAAFWFLRRYKIPAYSTQKFSRSDTLMNKTIVLPLRVPWKVKFDDYNPIRTEDHKFNLWWFKLCFTDGRTRLLCETSAFLFAYVPYNPLGRTGVSGRGILKYWGPNRVDVVVCMNKNNHKVNIFYKKTKAPADAALIHSGYIDHPANTDNAWFEGNIYVYKVRRDDLVEDAKEDYPWLMDIFK